MHNISSWFEAKILKINYLTQANNVYEWLNRSEHFKLSIHHLKYLGKKRFISAKLHLNIKWEIYTGHKKISKENQSDNSDGKYLLKNTLFTFKVTQ